MLMAKKFVALVFSFFQIPISFLFNFNFGKKKIPIQISGHAWNFQIVY